jgi:Mg-chelatase subunit ChlD
MRTRWVSGVGVRLARSILIAGFLAPATVTGAEAPNLPPALHLDVETTHERISESDRTVYLKATVRAADIVRKARQPLNIALVFDRSCSMAEDAKLGYVRKAAHLLVDNLRPEDEVSLTAFGHEVETLAPMHPAVNREYLHHRVDELHAAGWTNLSGGLLEGCKELEKAQGRPGRHHLVLLTDGLANRGVTDPATLTRLVQGCAARGNTITTIGLGAEYDEKLLARMAQAGGGRYVYVKKPEEIPGAMYRELGSLLDVVAQNVHLEVDLPDGVHVEQVFSRLDEPREPAESFSLGDLTSGDERVFLLKLELGEGVMAAGRSLQLAAHLSYDDIGHGRHDEARGAVTVGRAPPGGGSTTVNAVLSYVRLVEALDTIAVAVEGEDKEAADAALVIQRRDFPGFKAAAMRSSDQDFINKAFIFEHYSKELAELVEKGELHEHGEAHAALKKEAHYRRYLLEHHKPGHDHDHD